MKGPSDRSDQSEDFVNPSIQTGWAVAVTADGVVDFERYGSVEARMLAELGAAAEEERGDFNNGWASCRDVLVVFNAYLDESISQAHAAVARQTLDSNFAPCE